MSEISYSNTTEKVLSEASVISKRLGSKYVDARHIFIALYTIHSGVAYSVILKSGLRTEDFQSLAALIRNQNAEYNVIGLSDEMTDRTKQMLEEAKKDAVRLKADSVGTELVLLSILRDLNSDIFNLFKNKNINLTTVCIELLMSLGLTRKEAEKYNAKYVIKLTKGGIADKKEQSMLEVYGRDMTEAAKDGLLDPVVGRKDEILRVLQILGRRTKNNVCLVGEPGVGKTAIVEGIAEMIHSKQLPEAYHSKKIVNLDLNSMLAGTRYRGDFEERLKKTLDELKTDPDVILFIDELHTLIGAGGAEGTHDAANIFKPALSRGDIQVIGATTLEEYRKYIEKDAALERRFQPVTVDEPSPEETLEILNAVADNYQSYHGVKITDEAKKAAVDMAVRYINDRFLPDKAIDLLDEACSRLKMGKIDDITGAGYAGNYKWFMNQVIESALSEGDIEKASNLRKSLNDKEIADENEKRVRNLLVTADDIAKVVSVWTRIPVSRLSESEQSRLLRLEDTVHKRVIGQEEAIKTVSGAIRRSRVGLREENRPIGSFLFLGPTGVGKTEVSKALAEALFGDEKSLIRVDMSEYMEKHTVSKMIGSPPGYVGYDEGGQLSEKVRRNPYSVILFDEVEKAHPDVFNVLLQVLDDGIITDSQGRKVNFKNTIIIMTSNLGADKIVDPKTLGFVTNTDEEKDFENMKSGVMEEVKKLFKPEFLNRLDDIIVFRSLTEQQVQEITMLQLNELKERVQKNLSIELRFGSRLKNFIFEKGYDRKFGARPLRRTIQSFVEDPLSQEILENKIEPGDTVTVSVSKEKVTFKKK